MSSSPELFVVIGDVHSEVPLALRALTQIERVGLGKALQEASTATIQDALRASRSR